MTGLVAFPLDAGGDVKVEIAEQSSATTTRGLRPAEFIEKAGVSFEASLDVLKVAALAIAAKLQDIAQGPEQVDVEFGLKFGGQAGAFIASANTEAQFRIKMTWRQKNGGMRDP